MNGKDRIICFPNSTVNKYESPMLTILRINQCLNSEFILRKTNVQCVE